MKRLSREQAKVYVFDRSLPPPLRVAPGEKFILETEDASSGFLRAEGQSPLNRPFIDETWPPSANPVAGPIYIEGVHKGDRNPPQPDCPLQFPAPRACRDQGDFYPDGMAGGRVWPESAGCLYADIRESRG
jgi:hypothetical protein